MHNRTYKHQHNQAPAQHSRPSLNAGQGTKLTPNSGAKAANEQKSNYVRRHHPPSTGKTLPGPLGNKEASHGGLRGPPMDLNSEENRYSNVATNDNVVSENLINETMDTYTDPSNVYSSQTSKIPATKFTINKHVINLFSNPKVLADEIIRHKKISKRNIKKVSLFGNTVIIATDDLDTKRILQEEWPADAFKHGINLLKKETKETKNEIKMIIFAKKFEIDLECPDIKEQLLSQGILEASHVVSKTNVNKKTGIIKILVENKEKAEALIRDRAKIGFSHFKVQHDIRVLQCYKCSKFGHHAANCTNRLVCANCSEEHLLKDCPNRGNKVATRCANCGLSHYACSRSCRVMKEEINSRLRRVSPSYAEVTSTGPRNSQGTNAWNNPINFLTHEPFGGKNVEFCHEIKNITAGIQKAIEIKLNTVIKSITESISLLNSTLVAALKTTQLGQESIKTVESLQLEITKNLSKIFVESNTASQNLLPKDCTLRLSNSVNFSFSDLNNDSNFGIENV